MEINFELVCDGVELGTSSIAGILFLWFAGVKALISYVAFSFFTYLISDMCKKMRSKIVIDIRRDTINDPTR